MTSLGNNGLKGLIKITQNYSILLLLALCAGIQWATPKNVQRCGNSFHAIRPPCVQENAPMQPILWQNIIYICLVFQTKEPKQDRFYKICLISL